MCAAKFAEFAGSPASFLVLSVSEDTWMLQLLCPEGPAAIRRASHPLKLSIHYPLWKRQRIREPRGEVKPNQLMLTYGCVIVNGTAPPLCTKVIDASGSGRSVPCVKLSLWNRTAPLPFPPFHGPEREKTLATEVHAREGLRT